MDELYKGLMAGRTTAASLELARRWLRSATKLELISRIRAAESALREELQVNIDAMCTQRLFNDANRTIDMIQRSRLDRPFSGGVHWAGFSHFGVSDALPTLAA
jgi:hypothetical protein